ncbi:FAD:protein FMN transferase [Dyella amyloliquefaciens]|uniref:FAD:protein FMN transferase n=1 Tax=Dyella amyloliquefaciens TaxID=1770545 RepID=UPI00102E6A8B|nr:FAD:protein FMN transferase [Dyella amyloliquefaciens]
MKPRSLKTAIRAGIMLTTFALLTGLFLWLRPLQPMQGEFLVFGTRARIELLTPSRDDADAALQDIGHLFIHDHHTWHPWEPSELTRLNDALARGQSYRVPPDVADLIRRAQLGYAQTDGLFNAAAGRLIGAWGFHTSHYPVQTAAPSDGEVTNLLAERPDMDEVHIAADGTISASNPFVSIDINGLSEGYASSQVRELLARHGIHHALIYLGGFVMAVGRNHGQTWRIGVSAPTGVLGNIDLDGGESLASSGDYQRHRASSPDLGHIVDTRTGWPQRASAATSVLSDDAVYADIAATALMVAGPAGFQHMADHMQMNCALLLGHDGKLYITPGMRARLHTSFPPAMLQIIPRPSTDCRRSGASGAPPVVIPAGI